MFQQKFISFCIRRQVSPDLEVSEGSGPTTTNHSENE